MTVITGLFESSIFPSCVCRYQGFSGDPQVIPTLVAYKGTHFSVYNIKMLWKNLGAPIKGLFWVAWRLEILEEIFFKEWPEARNCVSLFILSPFFISCAHAISLFRFPLKIYLWLVLSWLSIVKARSHSVFATPKHLAEGNQNTQFFINRKNSQNIRTTELVRYFH